VIARESFDLRHNPAGLARLTLETNGALGLQPDALPALVDAICQASIELGDVVAETAEFHRRESLATKKRLFKEMLELHGAVKIALQTLSASIAATEPE
jgi:hypothetical protein